MVYLQASLIICNFQKEDELKSDEDRKLFGRLLAFFLHKDGVALVKTMLLSASDTIKSLAKCDLKVTNTVVM